MSNGTCIFVDGNNLFHSAMQASIQIDYNKLLEVLTEGNDYTKAVFYTGSDDNAEKQRSFLHWMTRNGWRVVKKAVQTNKDNVRRANLENQIITDMLVSVMNGAKTIILVSGDEDFVYPLSKIQDRDIRVVVAGFRNATSHKLMDVADVYVELDQADVTMARED
jgi:uncharacterized LabA/DUF88 family protein